MQALRAACDEATAAAIAERNPADLYRFAPEEMRTRV
jgi:hypothetical protein